VIPLDVFGSAWLFLQMLTIEVHTPNIDKPTTCDATHSSNDRSPRVEFWDRCTTSITARRRILKLTLGFRRIDTVALP